MRLRRVQVPFSWIVCNLFAVSVTILSYACANPTSYRPSHRTSEELEHGKIIYVAGDTAPKIPYGWQKKAKGDPPKCSGKEVPIYGACYVRAHPGDFKPPCEPPTVEWRTACYYPVAEPEKKPVSWQ